MSKESDGMTVGEKSGQYVTFILGEEEYGVEILKVQEIIGITPVTKVPYLPVFVKGVINLRGIVVPVIDLRLRFNLDMADYTDHTCVIIVKMGEKVTGMIVDTVSEVVDIPEEMVEPPPSFNSSINADFIQGMGKMDNKLVILLNVDRLLTDAEIGALGDMPSDAVAQGEPPAQVAAQ